MSLTAEQQAMRQSGIGASEIGTICGLSPYDSPFALYLRKRGLADGPSENDAMAWGNRLEPAIVGALQVDNAIETGEVDAILRPSLVDDAPALPAKSRSESLRDKVARAAEEAQARAPARGGDQEGRGIPRVTGLIQSYSGKRNALGALY